jgi:hypothetical protein
MFSAATVNSVFLENMRRLWRHDPRLAQRIDELPLTGRCKTHQTGVLPRVALSKARLEATELEFCSVLLEASLEM